MCVSRTKRGKACTNKCKARENALSEENHLMSLSLRAPPHLCVFVRIRSFFADIGLPPLVNDDNGIENTTLRKHSPKWSFLKRQLSLRIGSVCTTKTAHVTETECNAGSRNLRVLFRESFRKVAFTLSTSKWWIRFENGTCGRKSFWKRWQKSCVIKCERIRVEEN